MSKDKEFLKLAKEYKINFGSVLNNFWILQKFTIYKK